VKVARSGTKFSNGIRDQQLANPGLHFFNYRQLDRAIGSSRGPPPLDTVNFVEAVSAEICLVNTCFERRRLELLQSIAGLRHMLEGRNPEKATELISEPEEQNSVEDGSSQFWRRACSSLVEVLDVLTRLREYAVWNCFAVQKIHKRWSKHFPSDVQDKNLQAVIKNLQAQGAGEWLRQLRYYDGLEFAELYIAIENIQDLAMQPCSRQGSPDRPSPKCRPSLEQDAIVHSLASSGSDWLPHSPVDAVNDASGTVAAEPTLKEAATSLLLGCSSVALEGSTCCIACLSEIASPAPAKMIESSSGSGPCEAEASASTQFGCGHRLCHTCFGLGRNTQNRQSGSGSQIATGDYQAECAICRNCNTFSTKDSDGIRSFRGVLVQFQANLFMA